SRCQRGVAPAAGPPRRRRTGGLGMKVVYRRLLLVGLYVASLAAVAVVAAYYGRNFTGAGPIPTRSAFAGRLPSSPDGDRRRYQFYYGPNRAAAGPATFQGQGSQLGSEVTAGTFDVRISPYLPITPRVWFDTASMEWAGREELALDDCLARLRTAVQA